MNSCDLGVRTSESVCFGAPVLKVLSPDRMKGGREGGRRRKGGREGKGGSEGNGGRERGGGGGGIEEWTDTGNGGGGVWLGEDGE